MEKKYWRLHTADFINYSQASQLNLLPEYFDKKHQEDYLSVLISGQGLQNTAMWPIVQFLYRRSNQFEKKPMYIPILSDGSVKYLNEKLIEAQNAKDVFLEEFYCIILIDFLPLRYVKDVSELPTTWEERFSKYEIPQNCMKIVRRRENGEILH